MLHNLFLRLRSELNQKKNIDQKALVLFPIDSTIISLTSKLLWKEGYHLLGETHAEETSARFHPQVKLFSGINLLTAEPGGILIHFGQGHDSKYGEETIAATPKNGVNIMDRGFCKLERIKDMIQEKERLVEIPKEFGDKALDKLRYLQAFMCENMALQE